MRKDPTLACLLNLFLVGMGHVYLGQVAKGLFILIIGIVAGILTQGIGTLLVVAWAMYDAYKTGTKMNQPRKKTSANATS